MRYIGDEKMQRCIRTKLDYSGGSMPFHDFAKWYEKHLGPFDARLFAVNFMFVDSRAIPVVTGLRTFEEMTLAKRLTDGEPGNLRVRDYKIIAIDDRE